MIKRPQLNNLSCTLPLQPFERSMYQRRTPAYTRSATGRPYSPLSAVRPPRNHTVFHVTNVLCHRYVVIVDESLTASDRNANHINVKNLIGDYERDI
jgi:hypothetical protein